jgi:hypothetical protein
MKTRLKLKKLDLKIDIVAKLGGRGGACGKRWNFVQRTLSPAPAQALSHQNLRDACITLCDRLR